MSERKVSTDALETLGMIHPSQQYRDAIHLAVEPVIAGERLSPGEHIFLRDGKAYGNTGATNNPPLLGIVDPFLAVDEKVKPGQQFWLVIYPRKITSLRHVWSHPDLSDEAGAPVVSADKARSEAWLREWCNTHDCPDYDTVMEGLAGKMTEDEDYSYTGVRHEGDYLLAIGRDAHCDIPNEFWDHVEIVTGEKFQRATHFSCSC